jgi:hypothetical protein
MLDNTGAACWVVVKRFTGVAFSSTCLILCACGGSPQMTKSVSASLVSLAVTPKVADIPLGRTVQFKVMGLYSDNTSKDMTQSAVWTTSEPKVTSVDQAGLATSTGIGQAQVTATVGAVKAEAALTVSNAALTSILISPATSSIALGQNAQLTAIGTFTDKTTQDVTGLVTWSSSQASVAVVNSAGLATSKSVGKAIITATLRSMNASNQLAVLPAALVGIAVTSSRPIAPIGTTVQFTAKGTFTDGSIQDLTNSVAWSGTPSGIISVSSVGLATAKAVGTATVTASQGVARGTAPLTISSAALVTLGVTSSDSAIPLGTTAQFTAKGKFTDGTTQDLSKSVNWTSSPSGIVTVSPLGVATSNAVGAATVTATVGPVHGAAMLTVSPAVLVTIGVSSTNSSFPLGTKQQLVATGHFTDKHTRDITNTVMWASASPKIVSVTSKGLAAALAAGTATITASAQGSSSSMLIGRAVISVSAAQLTSINISPAKSVIPLGGQQSLVAIGIFTDGSNHDLTRTVTWTVDKPDVANISPGGIATAQKVGTTPVRSTLQGVSGVALLTVQPTASVGYFTTPKTNQDTAVRIVNPAVTGKDLCAMLYVFDQDQQMTECCGCQVSQDGLRTLSVNKDLLSNPLTGVRSLSGTIMLVPAEYASNPSCNASAITPSGKTLAWSTHVQNASAAVPAVTEDAFSATPLSDAESSALQTQCYFVQQLGSGHGACSCGTGK